MPRKTKTPAKAVETFASIIGRRLAIARKAAGFSQAAFARRLGVSPQRLSNWENGEHPLPTHIVPKIFEVARINADWLYLNDPSRLPADIHDKIIDEIA